MAQKKSIHQDESGILHSHKNQIHHSSGPMHSTFEGLSFIGTIHIPSHWWLRVKWHNKKSNYQEEIGIPHSHINSFHDSNGPMHSTFKGFSFLKSIHWFNHWWLRVKWHKKKSICQHESGILHSQKKAKFKTLVGQWVQHFLSKFLEFDYGKTLLLITSIYKMLQELQCCGYGYANDIHAKQLTYEFHCNKKCIE